MIISPQKLNKKETIITKLFSLIFLSAGFSQFELLSIRPFDILLVTTFIIIILKGKKFLEPFLIFFFFSFLYAYTLGGFKDIKILISNFIVFSLSFHLLKVHSNFEKIKYLKFFNISLFLSNIICLIFFLIPELRNQVVSLSNSGFRLNGFFNQPNGYAFVLILHLPISIYFFIIKKNIFHLINVATIVTCIFLTQSRGALISILFAYLILFLLKSRLKNIFYLILSIYLLAFSTITLLPDFLQNNFDINLSRLTNFSQNESNLKQIDFSSFNEERFYLIDGGLKAISKYPFGLGFSDHYLKIGEITGIYLDSHNYFINIILTYGIILGSCWIIIYAFLLIKGLRVIFTNKLNENHLFFHLYAILIAVSIFYLTHSTDLTHFFFLIALYVSMIRSKKALKF